MKDIKIIDMRVQPGDSAFLIDDSETAILYDEIGVSAGQRGAQVLLNPESLCDYVGAEFCDLTV